VIGYDLTHFLNLPMLSNIEYLFCHISLPGVPSEAKGTESMRCIGGIRNDDVIGIAMQQSGKKSFLL
jgi:hypothetical protein